MFVSEKVHDAKMPTEKRKEVAKMMGHSIAEQYTTYSKHSKLIHGENKN